MYFNPLGPTMAALFHIPIPGSDQGLLTFRYDNPFERQHAAFGMLPNCAATEEMADTVLHLFSANGSDSCPIFESLPTSVFHRDNWPVDKMAPMFSSGQAHRLFAEAATQVWPGDMASICDRLRRHRDPWERTRAELEDISLVPGPPQSAKSTFRREEYDGWFELVTDPSHVKAERANFGLAWQAAISQR